MKKIYEGIKQLYVTHPPRLSTCLLVAVYKYRTLSLSRIKQLTYKIRFF